MSFSYTPNALKISTQQMLFHSQTANLKTHSSIPCWKSRFGTLSEICCKRGKKYLLCFSFFIITIISFFNGLEVCVTCNQVAVNLMPEYLTFQDQRDTCKILCMSSFVCCLSANVNGFSESQAIPGHCSGCKCPARTHPVLEMSRKSP